LDEFLQPILNVIRLETKMCCRHDCRALRSLNFYDLRFTLCTILKGLCQGACSSSVAYQCVLHICHCSYADKRALRMTHDIIGSFCCDNNHLGGIPSSVVSSREDMSLTSMGVIDEAITTCFDLLLKAVSLSALQYALLNQQGSTLYA
jgi:hypothetical protein